MSYRLACELSDRFAAIAPVSGALNLKDPNPIQPVSVVIFHGTNDASLRYEGGKPLKNLDKLDRVDSSVADAVSFWTTHNGCVTKPNRTEKGNIVHETYAGGKQGTAVEVYTIKGGTHAWPGGRPAFKNADVPTEEISANDLMWEFFKNHPNLKLTSD